MCDYFSIIEVATMNTAPQSSALETLNLVATVSTILAGIYFVAANFIF